MLLIHKLKLQYLYHCKYEKLTDWEQVFIADLWVYPEKSLSIKQLYVLDKLYRQCRANLYWRNNFKRMRYDPEEYEYDRLELLCMYDEVHDFDR